MLKSYHALHVDFDYTIVQPEVRVENMHILRKTEYLYRAQGAPIERLVLNSCLVHKVPPYWNLCSPDPLGPFAAGLDLAHTVGGGGRAPGSIYVHYLNVVCCVGIQIEI